MWSTYEIIHSFIVLQVSSCYRNRDKLWLYKPFGRFTNKVSTSSSSFSVSRSAIRKALRSLDVEFWLNIPAWITYKKDTNLVISSLVKDLFQWVHYWPSHQHWACIWPQQGSSLPHCSLSWASKHELHSFGRYDEHDPGLGDPNSVKTQV